MGYYDDNARSYIDGTLYLDMSDQYKLFEKYLPRNGRLLDLGFGSGRDSIYFSNRYEVISIDNCQAFVNEGKRKLYNQVLLLDVRNLIFKNDFDGIWACASLLHIPFIELPGVMIRCYNALKSNGVMYMSFKYGDFEGERNGRYFTDLNEKKLKELLSHTQFKLLDLKFTMDVRSDRTEKWMNVVLKK